MTRGAGHAPSLAMRLAGLTGWKRRGAAYALGVCGTLALPPFGLFFFLVPSFTGLLWLLEGASTPRRRFLDGWWWGWGYFMTGLYWICIALLTDAARFGWLLPFTLLGLTGIVAIYPGMACALSGWIGRRRGAAYVLGFCSLWTGVEMLRGTLFTGFPWNLAGYAFTFTDSAMQAGSLLGAYGLTWFAALLGGCVAVLGWPEGLRGGKRLILLAWAAFALALLWGERRIEAYDALPQVEKTVPGVRLRLVQANIAQPHKWDPKLQMEGLRAQVRLTRKDGIEKITHVIWPETAVPYVLSGEGELARHLGAALPPGALLLTGSLRSEGDKASWKIWNSLMAIDAQGAIAGSYDKGKLVPFGEFLPLRRFVPDGVSPIGDVDFSGGPGPQTLRWPGLPPVSPLICYEAVFPELAANPADRPQWLLNVTNDAWFGVSTGPYQHFAMARMRAVEQGLPLVRVANTGISAVTDRLGRTVELLPLEHSGILDANLPAPGRNTTYARNDAIIMLVLIFLPFLFARLRFKG